MSLIRKQRSNYWWYDFTVGGKRYRGSTKRTNKTDARRVEAAEYERRLNSHQFGDKERVRLVDAMDRYLGTLRLPSTKRQAQWRRDKLFGDGPGFRLPLSTPLLDLTSALISTLVEARFAEGLAESTICIEVQQLKRVWKLAKDHWGYDVQPVVSFPTFRYKPKTRSLTLEEEERLLHELDPHRPVEGASSDMGTPRRQMMQDAYDLVVYLLDTGCRHGEAVSTSWSSVSMNCRTINLYRQKVGNEANLIMTDRLYSVIRRRWDNRGANMYVFPRWYKCKVDPKNHRAHSTESIRAAMNRAGLNDDRSIVKTRGTATVHTLRDTFATKLAMRGLSIAQIMPLLGHTGTSMTSKYIHVDVAEVSQRAADLLNTS